MWGPSAKIVWFHESGEMPTQCRPLSEDSGLQEPQTLLTAGAGFAMPFPCSPGEDPETLYIFPTPENTEKLYLLRHAWWGLMESLPIILSDLEGSFPKANLRYL